MVLDIFNYKESEVFHNFNSTAEVTKGIYKGIRITEFYKNYRHWGKKSIKTYLIDLIFPIDTYNCLSDRYYTAEGYGMPEFNNIDEAIDFINNYKLNN